MKSFRLGYSVGNLLLSVLLVSSAACKKHPSVGETSNGGALNGRADVIQIGEVGSLSGSEATFGVSTHQGIELAVTELNKAGGIKDKKLNVITLDDQSKPDEAATAVTKLITQNHVSAILGEVASSRSMAMAAISQDYKVPMVTPSSTNPKVTTLGDHIFRVCFIDPFQGEVMAKFALGQLKAKKVAILRDLKSDYSAGLSQFFKAAFVKGGGQVVVDEIYNSGDIDFKSQLTNIRAKGPEAIFVPGYYTEVGLIARQARDLGIKATLLGGDGWDSPKLSEIGGQALENSYFSNHYSSEDKAPHVQNFITKFKEKYGVVPDGLAAMGYDAAMVLADAMKRAKSLSTADIRDALAATKAYPGVTGNITIDQNRNAVKSAVVLKVAKNGYFTYQATINP
jgi:branched-chain amino acid transport system substrate-binding protein